MTKRRGEVARLVALHRELDACKACPSMIGPVVHGPPVASPCSYGFKGAGRDATPSGALNGPGDLDCAAGLRDSGPTAWHYGGSGCSY